MAVVINSQFFQQFMIKLNSEHYADKVVVQLSNRIYALFSGAQMLIGFRQKFKLAWLDY